MLGKRIDGIHEIKTRFQLINLSDEILIKKTSSKSISVKTNIGPIIEGNKNIVFTQKASKKTLNNTTIYKLPKKNFTKSVYQKIIDLNFNYILVEGGATTISNFLEQELLDIMQFIIAPIIIGSGIDSIKLKSISSLKNALRPKSHLYKLGDEMIASLGF